MDYGKVFRASVSWVKDPKSLKYAAGFFLFSFFASLSIFGIMYYALGPAFLEEQFSNPFAAEQPDFDFSRFVLFFAMLFPLVFALIFVQFYLYGLITVRSLELAGAKPPEFGFRKFTRFVLFEIWVSIMALTGWYNKLLFGIFALLMLVFFIGLITTAIFIGIFILLLWVLMFYAYCVVILYSFVRLSVSHVHFLNNDLPIRAAGRESWTLTHGKALPVFVVMLLVFAVNMVMSMIILIVSMVVSALTSNIVLPLIARSLLSSVISALYVVSMYFALTNVYLQLLKEKGQAAPTHAVAHHAQTQATPVEPKPLPAAPFASRQRPAPKPRARPKPAARTSKRK